MKNFINKLSFKFGRYAIVNLMGIIVISMAIVFVFDLFFTINLYSLLAFNKVALMQGEIWRIISFVFLPPGGSILLTALFLYFYWMIGSTLENEWGSFKFNLFYLFGIIGTIIGGLFTGYATNQYINLSLFFAFAILYPNFEILVFFILPVKMKYLAILNAVFFIYSLIISPWPTRIAIILSFLNLILFFGGDAKRRIKQMIRHSHWKR